MLAALIQRVNDTTIIDAPLLVILVVLGAIMLWLAMWMYTTGFRHGQIGALSSTKVMYSLEERKNGEREWRYAGGLNLTKPFTPYSVGRKELNNVPPVGYLFNKRIMKVTVVEVPAPEEKK